MDSATHCWTVRQHVPPMTASLPSDRRCPAALLAAEHRNGLVTQAKRCPAPVRLGEALVRRSHGEDSGVCRCSKTSSCPCIKEWSKVAPLERRPSHRGTSDAESRDDPTHRQTGDVNKSARSGPARQGSGTREKRCVRPSSDSQSWLIALSCAASRCFHSATPRALRSAS